MSPTDRAKVACDPICSKVAAAAPDGRARSPRDDAIAAVTANDVRADGRGARTRPALGTRPAHLLVVFEEDVDFAVGSAQLHSHDFPGTFDAQNLAV